jgi:hypothetical protein
MGAALRADFAQPVDFVSVAFAPDDTDSGVLQAYASNGDLLAETVNRSNSAYVLSYSGLSSPIAFVIATYGDTGRLGTISFRAANLVPEPSTLSLSIVAAMCFGSLSLVRSTLGRR